MNKKQEPERGGGVKIAKEITIIRELLDKDGNTISIKVQKPGQDKYTRPLKQPKR